MTDRPRKPLFPNPFYLLLLVSSTCFVVTALAYVVSPLVISGEQQAMAKPGKLSLALVGWLDRNGPLTLGIEFCGMLITGVLAMLTDQWFSPEGKPKRS